MELICSAVPRPRLEKADIMREAVQTRHTEMVLARHSVVKKFVFADASTYQYLLGSQIGTQTIHSQSANKWICCFDNTKKTSNCSSPTNITFEAPSPEVLFAESFSIITASATSSSIPSIIPTSATGSSSTLNQNIEISTTSSTSSTAIQTVTTTVTTTATALADDSSSLSTDAKAGIGVGIVVLFIIGLGALLIWRRRSHHRQQQQPEEPFMRHSSILKVSPDVTVRQLNEVDASERHAELPNNNIVHQIA